MPGAGVCAPGVVLSVAAGSRGLNLYIDPGFNSRWRQGRGKVEGKARAEGTGCCH